MGSCSLFLPSFRSIPRIPTLKNLEDLVTEYHGNFSVRTLPQARLQFVNYSIPPTSKSDRVWGVEGRGRGLH